MNKKWTNLLLLALAALLVMCLWFSASAVVPALTQIWKLGEDGRAWLTMSVQLGFVAGTLGSAVFNLSDRIPSPRLFAVSGFLAAVCTVLIPMTVKNLLPAIILRFLTGMLLAGVYPVGMKIMATWTRKDRGLAIGLLVGALTIGSGLPHFLKIFVDLSDWQFVLYLASGLAGLGSIICLIFVSIGPYHTQSPPFDWKYIGRIFNNRGAGLANLGYLGHMWELYAMWTWVPLFLAASFRTTGQADALAGGLSFVVIAIGGLGSLIAGRLADRYGRTIVTSVSMLVSGICALIVGFTFGLHPFWTMLVCLIWGFFVVADSAQFSAAISELAEPEYTGTALTFQTCLGFLLTLLTIRFVPMIQDWIGWRYAFMILALGPLVGIWAMMTLRRDPQATQLAGGHK